MQLDSFAPTKGSMENRGPFLRSFGILLFTDIVLCEKNCSSFGEKLLKFEAEGREFAKFLISLEQFIQTVKGQNNFW